MTHTLPECVTRLAELRRQHAEQSAMPECNDCCLPVDQCVCEDELTLTEPLAVDSFGLSVRGVMSRARGN